MQAAEYIETFGVVESIFGSVLAWICVEYSSVGMVVFVGAMGGGKTSSFRFGM